MGTHVFMFFKMTAKKKKEKEKKKFSINFYKPPLELFRFDYYYPNTLFFRKMLLTFG